MKSLNNNEMDFQEKLQKDTEIPVIVHERINQAYRMIENDTAMQKKTPKDPYHWMKIGGRIAGGMAAVLAVGFIFYMTNPVMAKNIPVVGGLFEILQDNVSFFGDFQTMQRHWKLLMELRQKKMEILLPTERKEIRQKAIRQGMKLPQMLRQQKKIPPTPKPLTV